MEISQKENIKRGSHGGRKTKLYHVWCSMKRRCFSKSSRGYRWYGARGITVCEEWRNDFACFRAWALDNGYKEGLSIERKNNDGDYCPENCRWATKKEQANNQRNTIRIEYKGEEKTLHEWADCLGIKPDTLYARIFRSDLSLERAFCKPVRGNGLKELDKNSVIKILTEISPNNGLFIDTLNKATEEQILEAIKIMKNRNEHDKSRLKYCESKIRAMKNKSQALKEMEGKK